MLLRAIPAVQRSPVKRQLAARLRAYVKDYAQRRRADERMDKRLGRPHSGGGIDKDVTFVSVDAADAAIDAAYRAKYQPRIP
jgi:hypothetical protein